MTNVEEKIMLDIRLKHIIDIMKKVQIENNVTYSTPNQIVKKFAFELKHARHVFDVLMEWEDTKRESEAENENNN